MIHPEVRRDIIAEYDRLLSKHPKGDMGMLWDMAKDYVRTVAIADSHILRLWIW